MTKNLNFFLFLALNKDSIGESSPSSQYNKTPTLSTTINTDDPYRLHINSNNQKNSNKKTNISISNVKLKQRNFTTTEFEVQNQNLTHTPLFKHQLSPRVFSKKLFI